MRLKLDAEKIERFRVANALLKRELAANAGVHPNGLSRIFRGEPVGVVVGRLLAKAMGVPVSEITLEIVADGKDAGDSSAVVAVG